MVDKQTENTSVKTPDPQPPSAHAAAPVAYRKTFGDKLFDIGVYGGIGYIANAAISLVLARRAVQRKDTQLYQLGKWSEGQFEKFFAQVMKEPEQVKKSADLANNVMFLGMGGWLLLLPMKWLEDGKTDIIQKLDALAGTTPESQQQRQAQIDRYDNGPKQGYGSLFAGRVVAYVMTVATALPFITKKTSVNADLNRFIDKHLGAHLGSLREPLLVVDGKATQMPAFVDTISKEVILAGTGSAAHYVFSKFFANMGHQMHQPALPTQGFVQTLPMSNATHGDAQQPSTQVRQAFHEATRVQEPKNQAQVVQ